MESFAINDLSGAETLVSGYMECDSSDPKTQKLIEETEEDIRKLQWLIVMAESDDPDPSSEWNKQIADDF